MSVMLLIGLSWWRPLLTRHLGPQARQRAQQIAQHYQRGELLPATDKARQALTLRRQLYSKAHFPQGHPDLALSLHNLGFFLQARGELAQAEPYLRDALAMYQQLYPKARY